MKKTLALILALAMALSIVACTTPTAGTSAAGTEATSATEEAVAPADSATDAAGEINLNVWVSNGVTTEAELDDLEENWMFSKLCRQFETENPGVKINMVYYADGAQIHQLFKAAAMTEDCPDIVNVYAGNYLFQLEDLVYDLSDMIPQEDKDHIFAWDSVTKDFTSGNPILAYPTAGNEVCGLFYNRKILAECGLDYDVNPPADLDAFLADLAKIKDAGYTPIFASDSGWGHSYLTVFAAWWASISGSARVATDGSGETLFSDDAGFTESMQIAADMYQKGFINADYASADEAGTGFLTGKNAFYATGYWQCSNCIDALGAENVGFFAPPSPASATVKNAAIGGVGQALCVSKTCKNPEMAVKFLSFLNNRENHLAMCQAKGIQPYRNDITAEDLGITAGSVQEQIFKAAMNYVFWVDNTLQSDVAAELIRLSPLVITGQMSMTDLTAALDAKAKEVN